MNKIVACLLVGSLYSMDKPLEEPVHAREHIPEFERIVRQYPAVTAQQPQERYNSQPPGINEQTLDELTELSNELTVVMRQLRRDVDIKRAYQLLEDVTHKKNMLRCFIWLQRQAVLATQPPSPCPVPQLPAVLKPLPLRWRNHPQMADYLAHH